MAILFLIAMPSELAAKKPKRKKNEAKAELSSQCTEDNHVPGEIVVKLKHKVDSAKALKRSRSLFALPGKNSLPKALNRKIRSMNNVFHKLEQPSSNLRTRKLSAKQKRIKKAQELKAKIGLDRIYKIKVKSKSCDELKDLIEKLNNDPEVEYAELNYKHKPLYIPNDPEFDSDPSSDKGWAAKIINADKAWDITMGEGIVVAVVDTGVDYNHEDLRDNIWVDTDFVSDTNADGVINLDDLDENNDGIIQPEELGENDVIGRDFTDNSNDPSDDDGFGHHGTQVSSLIAATGDNNIGTIGIAPKAKILPIAASDPGFFISYFYGTVVAEAFEYIADLYVAKQGPNMKRMIINGSFYSDSDSHLVEDICQYTYDLGIINIFGAGNSNADVRDGPSPEAVLWTTISVGATAFVSSASSTVPPSFTNYGPTVDLMAPGKDILAASNFNSTTGDSSYALFSGTSASTPIAAGAAALVLSQKENIDQQQLRSLLMKTSSYANSLPLDPVTGGESNYRGNIDALAALEDDAPLSVAHLVFDEITPRHYLIGNEKLVDIKGFAYSEDLESYSLEYSIQDHIVPNLDSITWISLGDDNDNSHELKTLYSGFDLYVAKPGEYLYFKLTTRDNSGNEVVDFSYVAITSHQNSENPYDVYTFGGVKLDDYYLIIDWINSGKTLPNRPIKKGEVDGSNIANVVYLDINADGFVDEMDVELMQNYLESNLQSVVVLFDTGLDFNYPFTDFNTPFWISPRISYTIGADRYLDFDELYFEDIDVNNNFVLEPEDIDSFVRINNPTNAVVGYDNVDIDTYPEDSSQNLHGTTLLNLSKGVANQINSLFGDQSFDLRFIPSKFMRDLNDDSKEVNLPNALGSVNWMAGYSGHNLDNLVLNIPSFDYSSNLLSDARDSVLSRINSLLRRREMILVSYAMDDMGNSSDYLPASLDSVLRVAKAPTRQFPEIDIKSAPDIDILVNVDEESLAGAIDAPSYAGSIVSTTIAMIRNLFPYYDHEDIRALLRYTGDEGLINNYPRTDAPVLNIEAAIEEVRSHGIPPIAHILSDEIPQELEGIIDLKGVLDCSNHNCSYSLEYGYLQDLDSLQPVNWFGELTEADGLQELSFTKEEQVVLQGFDTRKVPNGILVFRLQVSDTNSSGEERMSQDTFYVKVNNPLTHHNFINQYDVNNDGIVLPDDFRAVIDWINTKGTSLEGKEPDGLVFPDINNDGVVTALDALTVANYINSEAVMTVGDLAEDASPSTSLLTTKARALVSTTSSTSTALADSDARCKAINLNIEAMECEFFIEEEAKSIDFKIEGDHYVVTQDGETLRFAKDKYRKITLNLENASKPSVTMTGSSVKEKLELNAGKNLILREYISQWMAPSYKLEVKGDVADVLLDAKDGDDIAYLYDSEGSDLLTVDTDTVELKSIGHGKYQIQGFSEINADAINGGMNKIQNLNTPSYSLNISGNWVELIPVTVDFSSNTKVAVWIYDESIKLIHDGISESFDRDADFGNKFIVKVANPESTSVNIFGTDADEILDFNPSQESLSFKAVDGAYEIVIEGSYRILSAYAKGGHDKGMISVEESDDNHYFFTANKYTSRGEDYSVFGDVTNKKFYSYLRGFEELEAKNLGTNKRSYSYLLDSPGDDNYSSVLLDDNQGGTIRKATMVYPDGRVISAIGFDKNYAVCYNSGNNHASIEDAEGTDNLWLKGDRVISHAWDKNGKYDYGHYYGFTTIDAHAINGGTNSLKPIASPEDRNYSLNLSGDWNSAL